MTMAASMRCRWLVAVALIVASMGAVVRSSGTQLLDEMLASVAKVSDSLEPAKLAAANELGDLVGRGRLRDLMLWRHSEPKLHTLKRYNEEVFRQTLRQTTDVDAVTELLKKLADKTDDQLASASNSERAELIDEHLVPACRAYVDALKPAFDQKLDSKQELELAEAIREDPRREDVRGMVRAWANFGTCKTLLERDRSLLIDRIPKRIEDNKRIEAKRLARSGANSAGSRRLFAN